MIAWMGLAMMVSTRLWLAGTVRVTRDRGLADELMHQVRRSGQMLRPLLVVTDGWAAYPASIRRAFREKVKKLPGVGRASLEVWPYLSIGTVIKRTEKKRGAIDHPPDGSRSARSGRKGAPALGRGEHAQYRFY